MEALREKIILLVNSFNEGIARPLNYIDNPFCVIVLGFCVIGGLLSFIFVIQPDLDMRTWFGLCIFITVYLLARMQADFGHGPRDIYLDTRNAIYHARHNNAQPISLSPMCNDPSWFATIYEKEPNDEDRAIETIRQLMLYTIKSRVLTSK
jgi:hypothetical protein